MYEYFSAALDELAASTIDMLSGPGGPQPLPMPVAEVIRLRGTEGLRELLKPRLRRSPTGFYVVSSKGFDPIVDLGSIQETLTGADFRALLSRSPNGPVVAERDGGTRLVVTISDEVQALLANTEAAAFSAAAVRWVNDKESGDAAVIGDLLGELSALARGAIERDEHLYCWICVLSLGSAGSSAVSWS